MLLFFGFSSNFLHVSGQLLPSKGQPDLLCHLRDHSAIFAHSMDNFDTLGMSFELLWDPWLNVSATPITAKGCWQCLPLSVVQLKGKHCRKPLP